MFRLDHNPKRSNLNNTLFRRKYQNGYNKSNNLKNEHDIDRNDEWFLSQENKRAFISPINILDKVKAIISNIGSNQCVSDQKDGT